MANLKDILKKNFTMKNHRTKKCREKNKAKLYKIIRFKFS